MLFDDDRKPFANTYDQRLGYLTLLATMFNAYSASNKTRIFGLTADASNALHITLNGIVKLIMLLLMKVQYVLAVEFQSDKMEDEFGIYQQLSEGNYDILVQHTLRSIISISFQRFKFLTYCI